MSAVAAGIRAIQRLLNPRIVGPAEGRAPCSDYPQPKYATLSIIFAPENLVPQRDMRHD